MLDAFVTQPFPETIESGAIALDDMEEHVVAADAGPLSCADVWFNVETSWTSRVTVRVYGRVGEARVLLRAVELSRVPLTTGEDGRVSGIAISIRGRPCQGLEVTAEASSGTALSGGLVFLQTWHDSLPLSVSGGTAPQAQATEMVAARMVGRDADGNALAEIAVDGAGKLLMANPLFTDELKALLDGATAAATPDTLMKRSAGGGSALTRVELEDATQTGAPSGESWLWSEGSRLVTREPNGVTDAFTYADAGTGASSKLHRKYFARLKTTSSSAATALTIPASDLPSTDWSADINVRIHVYDVQHDRVARATRQVCARRTSGTLLIPTQTQAVGTDFSEGGVGETLFTASVLVTSGNIVVSVSLNAADARWSAWAEVFCVAH